VEDQFNILVVDSTTFDQHIGEEYDEIKEVDSSPSISKREEYFLYFRGIIRSIYHDVSKQIVITCDTQEDTYFQMFEDLLSIMKEQENISFIVTK